MADIEDRALADRLQNDLATWLPQQRWYGASDRKLLGTTVVELEQWVSGPPSLWWGIVGADFDDGSHARYQLFVGERAAEDDEADFLHTREDHIVALGVDGSRLYDALIDPVLALEIAHRIAPDVAATSMRPLAVEASNTSVVFDERVIVKVFRRIHQGPNPDADVTEALARVGFTHSVTQLARWQRNGTDLAVVREYLPLATDGVPLGLTSLRDLYSSRQPPEECGGDFAPESRRLGEITAQMHVALAQAYGVSPADAEAWADDLVAQLRRVGADVLDLPRLEASFDRLRGADDLGSAIRIHGDYHLGQVMRTDSGWFILDFEGEPTRPLEERLRPSSPLRDVAGMARSLDYVARMGLDEHGDPDDPELQVLAEAWVERNTRAFIEGYSSVPEAADLLPRSALARDALLTVFELGKAVYEVAYELAHRPALVDIPLGAVRRLLGDDDAGGTP